MLGTRDFFPHSARLNETVKKLESTSPHIEWLRRSYQQGKQISQIIAYIWRWADESSPEHTDKQSTAKQLKQYFANPTENPKHPMKKLMKLFSADARQPNSCIEAGLLADVFNPISKNMIFPIFDEFEVGEKYPELGYLVEINVNSFQGNLADATINDPQLLKWIIPFPPKPNIGESTVTLSELDEWVTDTDNNRYIPQNPYIPSSSC